MEGLVFTLEEATEITSDVSETAERKTSSRIDLPEKSDNQKAFFNYWNNCEKVFYLSKLPLLLVWQRMETENWATSCIQIDRI